MITSAYSNANYIITILVENPGNNVFISSYKIQTVYLTIGNSDSFSSENEDVLSIIVDAAFIINLVIFGGKSVVELSIGINKVTNIIEGVNLTLLLFAIFDGFTLVGLTHLHFYIPFSPTS